MKKISLWIDRYYRKIVGSIAFYPAIIAVCFLIFSIVMVAFDFSATGKELKAGWKWLSLKDAGTARSIISTVTGSIISLAVFSFSMVLIILNQTASQLSNRILDELIGNRFQQIVLGIYIGTIVFALYLMSTIRDLDSGISIPAISTYILILLTIVDIFLFLYFLHYITQSVKYQVLIKRIENETMAVMSGCCSTTQPRTATNFPDGGSKVLATKDGIYEGYNKDFLIEICKREKITVHIEVFRGTFVFKDLAIATSEKPLSEKTQKEIGRAFYILDEESINNNFFYGFRQLTEVAMKALSPGINDPATAVQCIRSLYKLLEYTRLHPTKSSFADKEGTDRIFTAERSYDYMFAEAIYPIWDYGKEDRIIQDELYSITRHLKDLDSGGAVSQLYLQVAMAKNNRTLPSSPTS